MQLKLRHLLLFVVACVILGFSDTPGGSLLAMAILMQLALLIHKLELSKKSQLCALKLFLVSMPLFFFWGGTHQFVKIYFEEYQYLLFAMALAIIVFLTLLLTFQVVFVYEFMEKASFNMMASLQNAFQQLRNDKRRFLKTASLLFVFSFVPWIGSDWKLIFALTATHLCLHWRRLTTVFADL